MTIQAVYPGYVQNINSVNEKISNSKEEKTSVTMSIGKLEGGTAESHKKPVRSVFMFNIAMEKLTMANELELMVFHII